MSKQHITIVVFMLGIALCQRLVEPAYLGYIFLFAILACLKCIQPSNLQWLDRPLAAWSLLFYVWLIFMFVITFFNDSQLRDVLRDLGALLAFFVGRYVLFTRSDPIKQTLKALSDVSIWIVMATLVAAFLAYINGAGAYEWRGIFIPPSHAWLPYLLVINYALTIIEKPFSSVYFRRFILCIVGILASLSRTDLVLVIFLLIFLLVRHFSQILTSQAVRRRFVYSIVMVALFLPQFILLDVVQNRIAVGIGEDDLSVGWRLMENSSFFDMMSRAGPIEWLVGFGFGARIPLPLGIVDFNDNSSIPHLHNSFLTVIVKFGIVGITALLIYLGYQWLRSYKPATKELQVLHAAGRWIVLFVIVRAVTLQALTEWSHVLFFGLGCAFMVRVNQITIKQRTLVRSTNNLL